MMHKLLWSNSFRDRCMWGRYDMQMQGIQKAGQMHSTSHFTILCPGGGIEKLMLFPFFSKRRRLSVLNAKATGPGSRFEIWEGSPQR